MGGRGGLSRSDIKVKKANSLCSQFVHHVLYKELEKTIPENVSEQEKKKPGRKWLTEPSMKENWNTSMNHLIDVASY